MKWRPRDQDSLQLAPIAALSGRRFIEKAAPPLAAYLLARVRSSIGGQDFGPAEKQASSVSSDT